LVVWGLDAKALTANHAKYANKTQGRTGLLLLSFRVFRVFRGLGVSLNPGKDFAVYEAKAKVEKLFGSR
jgi:hypothetical protein